MKSQGMTDEQIDAVFRDLHEAGLIERPLKSEQRTVARALLSAAREGEHPKAEPAGGSFMTREQATAFMRNYLKREPTERHIAACVDAYSALFGDTVSADWIEPGQAPPERPHAAWREALVEIHRTATDDKRGWSDWDRLAVLCQRALAGEQPAPAEWKLVPIKPTTAMLDKGAMEVAMNHQRVQTAEMGAQAIYRAMLAAAGEPSGDTTSSPSEAVQRPPTETEQE